MVAVGEIRWIQMQTEGWLRWGWLCVLTCVAPVCIADNIDTSPQQAQGMSIDQQQSRIEFKIGLMLFFDAEGVFESVDGRIDTDDDQVLVSARIPVASASMKSERYERMLEGPSFLDGESHPYIEFESDRLQRAELTEGALIPGTLCMRGECRRESFDLIQLQCEDSPELQPVCSMTVRGALKRSRYGMRTHRGALRNRIDLWMRLVAR